MTDTHLTNYERLDKLLMIIALAFIWAYKVGILRNDSIKALKIKKHGRLEKSLFPYGLEWVAHAFMNAFQELMQKLSLAFLSCT